MHLQGIQKFYMDYCNLATITDVAFVHLRGIHMLNMSGCNQATITGAAFVHLRGISSFDTTLFSPAVKAASTALLAEPAPYEEAFWRRTRWLLWMKGWVQQMRVR